ncbi:hypothetical protein [Croceivirga thetidis]|uniref:Uncharacterized protein n=1 Tax=Croceivirga thetidis TaxID=2721623 RepID=A0ABX1GPP0_9FLAO|nr:hypothetical protein [Croceivirga thetidis]NKI31888.1 hypothetical protein [Croceivirga thetidis]
MMDELELLKKDWQKKEKDLPKLSFDQIYKMIKKKSSSIVKWIFYISLIEFGFWLLLSFLPIDTEELNVEKIQMFNTLNTILDIVFYSVVAFFIYRFYQNYRKISAADNARNLMKKIIKTRSTVMKYVWFNLCFFALMMVVISVEYVISNPNGALTEKIATADNSLALWALFALILLGAIVFFALILWLLYRVLYGILLKRLNENYRELKKLEV